MNLMKTNTKAKKKKKNKYSAITSKCNKGHWHDSALEARVCNILQIMLKAGELKQFTCQRPYVFIVKNKKICTHIVDFELEYKDGRIEVWEAKGFGTREWVIKRKLFEALYPTIGYIVKTVA